MRKRAALAVTAILTGVMCSSAHALESTDLLGTWHLVLLNMDGTEMNAATLGMEMTLELRENGTYHAGIAGDDSEEGAWTMDDEQLVMIQGEAEDMIAVLEDGFLITSQEDIIMTFGRDTAVPDRIRPGQVVDASDLSDFEGLWNATVISSREMEIPSAIAEIIMIMEITDGRAKIHFDDGDTVFDDEVEAVPDGNVLRLTIPEHPEAMGIYSDTDQFELRLYENGMLALGEEIIAEEETEADTDTEFASETALVTDTIPDQMIENETELETQTESDAETEASVSDADTESDADELQDMAFHLFFEKTTK